MNGRAIEQRSARRPPDGAGRMGGGPGGQSSVEYLVAVALLSIALMVGDDSPLDQLMGAIAEHYQRFSYAISRP